MYHTPRTSQTFQYYLKWRDMDATRRARIALLAAEVLDSVCTVDWEITADQVADFVSHPISPGDAQDVAAELADIRWWLHHGMRGGASRASAEQEARSLRCEAFTVL